MKKKRPSVVKEARISNYPIKLNSIIKKEEVNEPLPWVVSIKDNNEKK
ncbi:MAG: hypothetical protein ORN85_06605 [Sediminibacterium sp.]|nr:hypothetical protein [Sediminibacterium sp.]